LAKPFSIQAPENIAKEYAGNKQKIAQAAQMGIVDPTAAVLAGMFIDRMRSAQVMEGAQQPTVAQQVLGGGQPQGAPPAPQQGMGPPPQGMPIPPQGMGAPPQMPMAPPPQDVGMAPPPQGMAMGGLTTLPVPDAMFDEPDNGSYAGGGMVAFAPGGDVDLERFRKAIIAQESGGDYGVMNAEDSGAMGAYQFMPPTARALAERLGLPYRPELLQGEKGRSKEGRAYQDALGTAQLQDALKFGGGDVGKAGAYHFAGSNTKGHGPKTRKYEQDILRRYSGSKDTGEMPERDFGTAEGRSRSVADEYQNLMRQFGPTEKQREVEAKRLARAEEMASDEYYEEQRKDSMYQTLAEIGFNMASSKSPYLLQAVGEAAAAAMPGARADKKERKALKDRALDIMGQMNDKTRRENLELLGIAEGRANTGLKASQFERELTSRENIAALDREATLAAAAAKDGIKPNTFEAFVETFYNKKIAEGVPENEARQFAFVAAKIAMEKIKTKYGGTGMEGLFDRGDGGSSGGQTANTFDYDSLKD
jgi:hypothetical protein